MTAQSTIQSSAWVHQIGWTLSHSVWQLTLITAAYALIVFVFRHGSAQARYITGCAALLLMLVVPVGTFTWLRWQDRAEARSAAVVSHLAPDDGGDSRFAAAGTESGTPTTLSTNEVVPTKSESGRASRHAQENVRPAMLDQWAKRIDSFMPWLSAGWLVGVLMAAMRPLWGWITVRRLRSQGLSFLSAELQNVAGNLIDRMGVRQAVEFAHSTLVEVPAVVGYLRPIVLLPVSTLSGLTVEQLRMVLAHELAHVRRHDYLVNAAQTIIETLLFFHPGAWWVSARVRKERENCCDDIAIDVCGNRETYARALCSLETLRTKPLAAAAVAANGGSLLERIRRILGNSTNVEPTLQRNAAWLGGLVVVFAMGLTLGMLTYNVAAVSASDGVDLEPANSALSSRIEEQQQGDLETSIGNDLARQDVKKAVAEIERLGGDFQETDGKRGRARIVSVNLSAKKLDDEALSRLAPLTDVHTLTLNRTRITDAGLKQLRDMKQLQWLELEGTPINGSGLSHLVGMKHLLTLRLGRTKVGDASLVHVMQMKGLLELWVQETQITQAGLRELWKVRPTLRVVGADGLKPGDPAQARLLLSATERKAGVGDVPTQRNATKLVMDAMRLRDQRVQSFRFEWNTRHQQQPGTLRDTDTLLFDGAANREEVVYDIQTKMSVDSRRLSFEFSGQRPKVEKKGDVLLRREAYRSAFDGMSERSLFEYPGGSDPPQGFQNVAGVSEQTKLAETAPLLWSFCTFDEAMVNHDWNQLEILDEPATVNGFRCVVLTGNLQPLVIGSEQRPTQVWYIDAERDYAIVRYEHRLPDGRVALRTDIDHSKDPHWGWLPSGWTITRNDSAGKSSSMLKATVTQYQINPKLPDEVFELEYPENTHMN